jgi:hypothetical protein
LASVHLTAIRFQTLCCPRLRVLFNCKDSRLLYSQTGPWCPAIQEHP